MWQAPLLELALYALLWSHRRSGRHEQTWMIAGCGSFAQVPRAWRPVPEDDPTSAPPPEVDGVDEIDVSQLFRASISTHRTSCWYRHCGLTRRRAELDFRPGAPFDAELDDVIDLDLAALAVADAVRAADGLLRAPPLRVGRPLGTGAALFFESCGSLPAAPEAAPTAGRVNTSSPSGRLLRKVVSRKATRSLRHTSSDGRALQCANVSSTDEPLTFSIAATTAVAAFAVATAVFHALEAMAAAACSDVRLAAAASLSAGAGDAALGADTGALACSWLPG